MKPVPDSSPRFVPSAGQKALFAKRLAGRSFTLICLLNYGKKHDQSRFASTIATALSSVGGTIRWQGRIHQPLNNAPFDWQETMLLDLPDAQAWGNLQAHAQWRQAQELLDALEIRVGVMPAAVARILAILRRVFRLLPLSKAVSKIPVTSEFLGDLDPIEARYNAMRNRDPHHPIVILNFHKFREQSAYAAGHPQFRKGLSGHQAYMRYGRKAVRIILGRGNRPVFVGGYLMTLVGNNGEPGPDLYDEITLMQYRSGPEFAACFELRAMEGAAGHRRAGLSHCMFAVTEPTEEFIAP